MSKDLTYKLSKAEIAPPAGCWKQIEDRLDKEYNLSDIQLSSRLSATEISPPVLAWQNIQPYLADIRRAPARVVPMTFKRIAIAASILGIIGFTGWYILQNSNNSGTQNQIVVTNAVGSVVAPKNVESTVPSVQPGKKEIKNNSLPQTPRSSAEEKATTGPVKRKTVSSRRIGPAKVGTISSVQQILIQAPPIRDAEGNLIMDVNLLRSSENDHYITVTGPNGQQTRISDKFLNMIQYLNAQDNDFNFQDSPERRKWKSRIKEWRSKLLEQAGYFPANNYMGIMDLKELIQDK